MIGSFLTRAFALALGYAYPAYECFKAVELNKPEIDQLRFWCQYWILVAVLTVFERVGESFISWLPMYSEAKVAFFVYLWYPKTRGTSYVYETFFRPYVAKHETEIDRNLLELRTRAGDMVVLYTQRIVSYGQTRFFEILQYVASQSPSQSSRARPTQRRQQAVETTTTTPALQPPVSQPPPAPARPPQPPVGPARVQPQEPAKGAATSSLVAAPLPSTQLQSSANTTTSSSSCSLRASSDTVSSSTASSSGSLPASSDTVPSSTSPGNEADPMQVEVSNPGSNKHSNAPPPPQETPMEAAIRVTRGRLRKRAATAGA